MSHGTFRRDGQWDGVYGVGHGGGLGQSPCVPWYIQTGWTVGMGYMEWDMGEGLYSPHVTVSHGIIFMLKWDMQGSAHTALVNSGCQQPVLDSFNQHSPSPTNQYFLKLYNVHDIRTCPP